MDCGISCLAADPSGTFRVGVCSRLNQDLLDLWPASDNHIMRIEALAVVVGIVLLAEYFRGRTLVWFVDNSSALGAFLKGHSRDPLLHVFTQLIHLLLFKLDVRVWWEWVETDANWSDGASRLFSECDWATRHQFQIREVPQTLVHGLVLSDVLCSLQSMSGIGVVAEQAIAEILSALEG